ncbi:MAG: gliding motility-associated C-terminal domain-containing protein [Candidatus Zixiibacteriota bacterium]
MKIYKICLISILLIAFGLFAADGFSYHNFEVSNNNTTQILEQLDDYFYYAMGCRDQDGGVDIVFCIDSSGSMGGEISDVQDNIVDFIAALESGGYDYQLGGIPYGDSTLIWDFDDARPGFQMTDDPSEFISLITACGASGGGDGPEVLMDAIADAIRQYEWRPTSLHVILGFTDAPSHELGDGSEWSPGYPYSDEDPDGVYDLVMSSGSVVFLSASPYSDTPIGGPEYRAISEDSGGEYYALDVGWDVIFPDVVGLIGESFAINISAANGTGTFLDTVYATLLPGPGIDLMTVDTLRYPYVPAEDTINFGWRVILDPDADGSELCFNAVFWGPGFSYMDTVTGCATNTDCFASMPQAEIVNPAESSIDACPNDSIVMLMYDTMFVVDTASIEIMVERRVAPDSAFSKLYTYHSPELRFDEPDLVIHPDPPFASGEITTVIVQRCLNNKGVSLPSPVYWTFLTDLEPPIFFDYWPTTDAVLATIRPDSIVVSIEDLVTGVDPSSIIFRIDGTEYTIDDAALEYDVDRNLLYFDPLIADLRWSGGDTINIMTVAGDSTVGWPCGANIDSMGSRFFIATGGPPTFINYPEDSTISSCIDQIIRIDVYDENGLDLSTLELNIGGEHITWPDARLEYNYDSLFLVFTPDEPFENEELVNVEVLHIEDSLGNAGVDLVSWYFMMDLMPPQYELVSPPESLDMVLNNLQMIQVDFYDNLAGVDVDNIEFELNDEIMDPSTYRIDYDPETREGDLRYNPDWSGERFIQGDTIRFRITASDSTDYCADNESTFEYAFIIEPMVTCYQYPNPFTPNSDGFNDKTVFEFPFMYSEPADLKIFDRRRQLIYEDELGPVLHTSDYDSHLWNGRDNNGNICSPGIYIYVIERDGELICEGTLTLIR